MRSIFAIIGAGCNVASNSCLWNQRKSLSPNGHTTVKGSFQNNKKTTSQPDMLLCKRLMSGSLYAGMTGGVSTKVVHFAPESNLQTNNPTGFAGSVWSGITGSLYSGISGSV